MKVQLTVYKGCLVIETIHPEMSHPDFVPNGGTRFGCVLSNVEKNLGASDEAMKFIRDLPRCRDAIGDIMAFESDKSGTCFGWMGGPFRIVEPDGEAARDTLRDFVRVVIPNEAPEGAKNAIDES